MDTQHITDLYRKYLDGSLTKQEQEIFHGLVLAAKDSDRLSKIIDQDWTQFGRDDLIPVPEDTAERVFAHIVANPMAKKRTFTFRRYGIAAAIAAITLGVWLYKASDTAGPHAQPDPVFSLASHITPGKQGATLTLSNGKQIKLTGALNGQLAEEIGVAISKTADGQLVYKIAASPSLPGPERIKTNTLSTAKGETYQVLLPDGSRIWLNAATTLSYPASFSYLKKRQVKLTGEAYFQVAKDTAHPFIVESGKQEVEVLGTHFNINAYNDEQALTTTLLEGSVKINQQTILKPGQQSVLTGQGGLQVNYVDTEEAVAWKKGDFVFNEEKISIIMRQLERWYNVEIKISDKLANKEFTGKIARSRNISQVLSLMEETNRIRFKIEGRRITAIEK